MTALKFEGLVKRRGEVPVVDEASLEVAPGELTVVLGPRGSGKTSLARLLCGLDPPDEGELFLDGRLVRPGATGHRDAALVSQAESLWPHLSVAENIAIGPRARGGARRDVGRRVDEAISVFALEGLADRHPEDLSPLQRLRAELARAVVLEPEVLLVDEPFARLDDRARWEVADDLRRLNAEAVRTILVFTREAREALSVADRLAVMDLGRIVQAGPPRELYERPSGLFVAQLLGPTNILQGQAEGSNSAGPGRMRIKTPLGPIESSIPTGGSLATGTPVSLSIRPESVRVSPSPSTGPNRFVATLDRVIFRGSTVELALRGPGDWPLSALCLRDPGSVWREGQSLTVEILAEEVVQLGGRFGSPRPPGHESS